MHKQLWGYKAEVKLYVGVREQKSLNTTALKHTGNIYIYIIYYCKCVYTRWQWYMDDLL
jgi:hypothetical protein